jgi:hypothetical protein
MSLDIANEDYQITIIPLGAWEPGDPNYTIFKATKLKANSKFALIMHILWTIKNCTKPGYTFGVGSGLIMPTGTKCFTNTNNRMRKTDTGQCSGSFTNTVHPFDVVICSCQYTITDAGQSNARCE